MPHLFGRLKLLPMNRAGGTDVTTQNGYIYLLDHLYAAATADLLIICFLVTLACSAGFADSVQRISHSTPLYNNGTKQPLNKVLK